MTELSRELLSAAVGFADATSDRIADTSGGTARLIATVTAVVAGAASDGNAKVTVTWRGKPLIASGYASSYTPVNGHRVLCDLIDNQLIVAYRVIGKP